MIFALRAHGWGVANVKSVSTRSVPPPLADTRRARNPAGGMPPMRAAHSCLDRIRIRPVSLPGALRSFHRRERFEVGSAPSRPSDPPWRAARCCGSPAPYLSRQKMAGQHHANSSRYSMSSSLPIFQPRLRDVRNPSLSLQDWDHPLISYRTDPPAEEQVAGRMALDAVTRAIHQIGAPVPFIGFGRIRLERGVIEEQELQPPSGRRRLNGNGTSSRPFEASCTAGSVFM